MDVFLEGAIGYILDSSRSSQFSYKGPWRGRQGGRRPGFSLQLGCSLFLCLGFSAPSGRRWFGSYAVPRLRAPPSPWLPPSAHVLHLQGDQLTGPSVRLLGPRPAPPLPHHLLQELACPRRKQPKDARAARDLDKLGIVQDGPPEAGGNLGS